ncbi:MAG: outer membrane beta-barrel protein [Candidatus Kapabacteria bacterium]|nr:outer membrane beta-barrel protein [Candidatus Kapabacteria bacterium]
MKKPLLTIALIALSFMQSLQLFSEDLTGYFGFSLTTGSNIPTNGKYSSSVKTTDLLNVGPQLGLEVSYFLTPGFGLEIMHNTNFNFYKDKYKPSGKEPVMCINALSLDAVYNFGHLFDKPLISPFIRAGVGGYYWGHLEDGLSSDVMKLTTGEHKATDIGFNVGVGADFAIVKNFTIGLVVDYNMFFPEDEAKFGKDFKEQGYIVPQLKFTYHFLPECCKK